MAKLKIIRDEKGSCICEDCSKYSVDHKCCSDGRRRPDSADECVDFRRAYGVYGANDARWHN